MEEFKKNRTLEQRKKLSRKQLSNHIGLLPLIIVPSPFSKLPEIKNIKYLIDYTNSFLCSRKDKLTTVSDLLIKKIQKVDEYIVDKLIFFSGTKQMNEQSTLQQIYNKYKDEDGFLYLHYYGEIKLNSNQKKPQKSDDLNDKQQLSLEQNQNSFIQLEKIQINLKCTGNNQTVQICCQNSCKEEQIFMCLDQSCPCRKKHQKCSMINVQSAVKKVKRKFIDYQKSGIEEQIDKVFDKIIDDVSTIRDQLINTVRNKIKCCLLDYEELQFLKFVETGQKNILFDSRKFRIHLNKSTSSSKIFENLKETLNKIKQLNSSTFLLCNKEITSVDKMLSQNNLQQILQLKQIMTEKLVQAKQHIKFKQSSILSNDHQILSLWLIFHQKQGRQNLLQNKLAFLKDKPFESATILFKASQENFNINRYFEKCGSATNTFILCKTNMDKVIGAYTPLSHNWDSIENKDNPWTHDKQGKSFIFTLHNVDKFELKKPQRALYRDPEKKRIKFGQSELEICDRSNLNQECFTEINKAYNANFYELFCKDNFSKMINGNPSSSFTTKQWEVWQLHF